MMAFQSITKVAPLLLLSGFLAAGGAKAEALGELHPGIKATAVEKLLGKPSGIEGQPPECPDEPPQAVWDYSDRGLVLVIEGNGPKAELVSVSNFGDNRLETGRGVRIGATYEQVLAAYPKAADASPESFLVETENGALEVSFSGGEPNRVTRILLSSQPALVYREGRGCGTAEYGN
jgi:hypothetical protein